MVQDGNNFALLDQICKLFPDLDINLNTTITKTLEKITEQAR